MLKNFRSFEAGPDPFGRKWKVEFAWIQNAISIRHDDSVDVKFMISDGEAWEEKVIALRHPDLLELSRRTGQAFTDPWCCRLAAEHLSRMIETSEDMEKTIVHPSFADLEQYASEPQVNH